MKVLVSLVVGDSLPELRPLGAVRDRDWAKSLARRILYEDEGQDGNMERVKLLRQIALFGEVAETTEGQTQDQRPSG